MIAFSFYLFSICVLVGGFFTVVSRQPVHSVLWLILAFLSAAGLFVLLGAELVAMLLIIVYVGAVAVLFLFVVMIAKKPALIIITDRITDGDPPVKMPYNMITTVPLKPHIP